MFDYHGNIEYESNYFPESNNKSMPEIKKAKKYFENGQIETEGEYVDFRGYAKVKEYNKVGQLRFEGEYLNNYRRKGKQYNKGILIFEGDFLFDKVWDGKIYDKNGNVINEIKNGNGKIREFDIDGEYLKFEGELLNGERNGKGKEYDENGQLKFEGEYSYGERKE